MTPTHTKRGDMRYRYYVTHTANKRSHEESSVRMVRTGDLEGIVFDQIKAVFRNQAMIVSTWEAAATMDEDITEEEGSSPSRRSGTTSTQGAGPAVAALRRVGSGGARGHPHRPAD
jgi:hypothetical protein